MDHEHYDLRDHGRRLRRFVWSTLAALGTAAAVAYACWVIMKPEQQATTGGWSAMFSFTLFSSGLAYWGTSAFLGARDRREDFPTARAK